MNLAELRKKLLAAARAHPPGWDVPYAFEKRVMARLAEKPALDLFAIWNPTLWQAVAPCLAVTLFLGVWTSFAQRNDNSRETLAADLDNRLYAAVENQTETWSTPGNPSAP